MASLSVGRILNDADALYASLRRYLGVVLKADKFLSFYSHISVFLRVPDTTVEASLRYLLGRELTHDLLTQLCVRLVANCKTLSSKPVTPWRGQSRDEWCVAVISAARQCYRNNGDKGGMFKFFIITGPAAGMSVVTWWSQRVCQTIARRMGFPRRRGDQVSLINYRHPRDMVRLRLSIRLSSGATDTPTFRETKVSSASANYNRKLLKRRFRVTAPCPKGYAKSFPCHNCPHGLGECQMATHRFDFVQGVCTQCKQESTFDVDFGTKICLECLENVHAPVEEQQTSV